MASLNFSEKVRENTKDMDSMESLLGKGLLEPFNNTNAGVSVAQYIQ